MFKKSDIKMLYFYVLLIFIFMIDHSAMAMEHEQPTKKQRTMTEDGQLIRSGRIITNNVHASIYRHGCLPEIFTEEEINTPNEQGQTALHLAFTEHAILKQHRIDLIRNLVALPYIKLNTQDAQGRTPLFAALERNREYHCFVKQILDAGADVNIANGLGTSPLHQVMNHKSEPNPRLISHLLNQGANPNEMDNNRTLLEVAMSLCSKKKLNYIHKFLEAGADVNLVNDQGQHALFKATAKNLGSNILQTLIDYGANINLADHQGQTSLYNACLYGNQEALHTLITAQPSKHSNNIDKILLLGVICNRENVVDLALGQTFLDENKTRKTFDKFSKLLSLHDHRRQFIVKDPKIPYDFKAFINRKSEQVLINDEHLQRRILRKIRNYLVRQDIATMQYFCYKTDYGKKLNTDICNMIFEYYKTPSV